MNKRFTTYYLKYSYSTFTWIFLLLSLGLFNVVYGREVFKFTWIQVILWIIWVGLILFFIQRQRVHINNGRMFMQGTFSTTDIDIDLKKITKVKKTGRIISFTYEKIQYKIITSKKLEKILLNVKK